VTEPIAPPRGLVEWLDEIARATVPAAMAVVLLLVEAVPLGVPGAPGFGPRLAWGAVFYWSLARPQLMNGPVAFLLGLFADLLGGTQPGLQAFVFLLLHAFARRAARSLAGRSFLWLWLGFVFAAVPLAAVEWGLRSLFLMTLLPSLGGAVQIVFTAALFPTIAMLSIRADQAAVAR